MTPTRATDLGVSTAAARHDAMVAAYDAQRARFAGDGGDAWAGCAQAFKMDRLRPLDALLTKIASYLRADDTLIDVGGGAGRLSLPLALRCRDVVIIDPSAAMENVFQTTAKDAGISNARFVRADWLDAKGIEGDVALVAHVTYFVPAIVPFIEKVRQATRRRVVVGARSVPPPNQIGALFRLAHEEELALVPGPVELMTVLGELGITAELIDIGPAATPATMRVGKTPEEAIRFELEAGLRGGWLRESDVERVRPLVEEQFDDLFAETEQGFWRRSALEARDLLITWEPA